MCVLSPFLSIFKRFLCNYAKKKRIFTDKNAFLVGRGIFSPSQGRRRAVKLTDIILPLKSGRSSREPPLIRGTLQHPHTTKKHPYWDAFLWWAEVDSNHRSRRRQIYSLIHLAALESAHIFNFVVEPVIGLEPTTC